MKAILFILIIFLTPHKLIAQSPKFYYTGRVYSKFNRELIDESKKSRPVSDPLESINSINVSVGLKVAKHLRPELGFSMIQQSNQREAFDLVVKHLDFQYTIKFGIIDSLGSQTTFMISPYFSIIKGKGYVLNNGTKTGDNSDGIVSGIQFAVHKKITNRIGVQPILHIQYEHFQNYRSVNNGPKIMKEFGKIFPSINLTYNF